jgi:tetratricopeptide (TPR) repeat protein
MSRLEEAVSAFREALKENTRARVLLQWAETQAKLGFALFVLGTYEGNVALVEEAVAAYHDALQERTRARVPLQWAVAQQALGMALEDIGEQESGTARLEEAVTAFREALQESTANAIRSNGPRPRRVSAMRSFASASGRVGRRG